MRLLETYAQTLISAVNLQPGQNLYIRGEPTHWNLINAIAAEAYRHGGRYVEVHSSHVGLHCTRVRHVHSEWLDYSPTTLQSLFRVLSDEDWAYIAIGGREDPHAFEELDQTRHASVISAYERARAAYLHELMTDRFNWLVCAGPTIGWAAQVLGGPADEATRDALWELMIPILRLDHPDPMLEWWRHTKALQALAEQLTLRQFTCLHFHGVDTDLSVGIPSGANWKGGRTNRRQDFEFISNLPTEEVYTTPDYRQTEGVVHLTRPAEIFGMMVEDVALRFERGVVVDFDAGSGRETLARMLDIDEGARRLGEIALVDCTSPIYACGQTFCNILFDENAACHLALGKGYPRRIAGGETMSQAELDSAGVNCSAIHVDVMFGSEELSVEAETGSGEVVPIMRDGRFVEAFAQGDG